MENKYCMRAAIKNESDVEQKLLYPLIKELGYLDNEIHTKETIEGHFISKGKRRKKYIPDYVVYVNNKPILVIEAKNPEENIDKYAHEPQDYAVVVNRKYIGINPIKYSLISNGDLIYLLKVDEEKPFLVLEFTDLIDKNEKFKKLKQTVSKESLTGVLREDLKKAAFHFDFVTPDQSTLLRIFRECHNHIWATESLKPTDAFREFTKIIFVKLNCDKELEEKIRAREKITLPDVPFSEKWLVEQKNFFENPFDEVLFKKYRNDLIKKAKEGETKAFFEENEKINLKHETILYVVRLLQNYNLYGVDEDVSGKVFEVFLNATVRGRELGQFFTPRNVINAMIEMANISITNEMIENPDLIPTILDACCGTGGFLIKLLEDLSEKVESLKISKERKELLLNKIRKEKLIGIDSALDLVRVARMNMYIHKDGGSSIYHADSVDKRNGWKMSYISQEREEVKSILLTNHYDYVFTNPPFAKQYKPSKKADREILIKYEIAYKTQGGLFNTVRSNALFLERYWELLRPGGYLFTILDDTPLNGNGKIAKRIRKFIREKFIIVGVISLPSNTFKLAETATKTSILILRKKENDNEPQGDTFYALCTNVGHDNFGNPTPNLNQLPEVVKWFQEFNKGKEIIPKIYDSGLQIFTVPPEELRKEINVYWLCPERKTIHLKLEILEKQGKIKRYWIRDLPIVGELKKEEKEKLKFKYVKYVRIRDITQMGIIEDYETYEYLYPVPKGAYTMPQRQRGVKTNDLLVVRNPVSLGKIVIVPKEFDGEFVTDGFLVLRFPDGFIEDLTSEECALLFSALFQTEIVLKQMWYSQREAVQPDNKVETLKERVIIPVPTNKNQIRKLIDWAKEFENRKKEIYTKKDELRELETTILEENLT